MRCTLPALVMLLACRAEPDSTGGSELVEVGALAFERFLPTNVLMISIDTLRRDHVGRYSGEPSLTPFLDSLMQEGVVLEDFKQCTNWTFPSVVCTLLGRTNIESGFLPKLDRDHRESVPEGTPFVAVRLRDAGWSTYYESTNTWFGPQWATNQGYETRVKTGVFHAEAVLTETAEAVADAVSTGDSERWFMHVHVKEPHPPYVPLVRYLGELEDLEDLGSVEELAGLDLDEFGDHYLAGEAWPTLAPEDQALLEAHLRVRYRGEVQWLDQQLSDSFAAFEELGLLEDTLVVIWSDHGEAFWERGHQSHAYTLHGEESDAIAFFWAKNLRPRAWTAPTTSIDLVPTVLASVGQHVPEDVTGEIVGTASPSRFRHALTLARLGAISSVERSGVKLIFQWTGEMSAYDRRTDPLELVDIYDPTDPQMGELWEELRPRVEAAAVLAPELPVTWP